MTRADRGRHEPFAELISASLTGDLTEAESAQLEAHLRECVDCRATLDAFVTGRRLVAGLHHIPPPRDLHARVRAGIEQGTWAPIPWWRRPAAVFAGLAGASAVVAAAMLVLVLNQTDRNQVAQTQTPAPTFSASTPSAATPQPEATAQASLAPPPPVEPSATPIPATPAPEPQTFLTLDVPSPDPSAPEASTPPPQRLSINNVPPSDAPDQSPDPIATLPPVMGPPIAAALSPIDGQWLAYLTEVGEKGTVEIWLARQDGEALGPMSEGLRGSPFTEVMSWSPDGRYLVFTLIAEDAADPEGTQEQISDVWLVDIESSSPKPQRLTSSGRAIAGTFDPEGNLWLTVVAETPTSLRLPADALAATVEAGEPLDGETLAAEASLTLPDLFQPLVAPDGSALIAWQGRFDDEQGRLVEPFYSFTQGGAPQLVELVKPRGRLGSASSEIGEAKPLFGDLTIDRDAFQYAAIAWGPDSQAIAVWDAAWSGEQQEEAYPDPLRVYFGKSNYPEPINRTRALDVGDLPGGIAQVIDVAVAPDGKHLAITVSYPRVGTSDAPRADLILVRRHTGNHADESRDLVDSDGWEGPAVYPYWPGEG